MTRSVCFDVPALPKLSANRTARMYGRWYAIRESERMAKIVANVARAERLMPVCGPVSVSLTFYWPNRRRHDPDNGTKQLLDAIVKAGLIDDDGPPTLVSLHIASRYDKSNPRTEITITAADAPAWELPTRRTKGRTAA